MSTAKVIIKGENQISSAIKGAKSDLSGFSQAAQKVGDTLKKAFTITAVIASLKKLGDACVACFDDFSQANRAYKQLALALKDQSGYKSVIANIDKLSRQTLESKDGIEAMVSELAALGKSADEINRISDAAVALSNVTGKDLNSSMTTLLNTYKGTTTQLNKLGIDTSEFTKEQLKSGAAVDLVISKFSKLSESMAEADTKQHKTNILNTIGDIKQQIGGVLDYNFGPMIAKLDNALQSSFGNIQKVVNYTGAVMANFPKVAGEALNLVGNMVKTVFSWDFVSAEIETIAKNIETIAVGLFNIIENDLPSILTFAGQKVGSFFTNLAGITLSSFETILAKLVNLVKPFTNQIISDFLFGLGRAVGSIENLFENIADKASEIGNSVVVGIKTVWAGLESGFLSSLSSITGKAEDIINSIADFIGTIGNSITNWVVNTLGKEGRATILDVISTLLEKIEDVLTKIKSAFKDIGNQAISDILSIISWALDKAETALESIVNVFARSKLGQWLGAKETKVNLGAEKLLALSETNILGTVEPINLGSDALSKSAEDLRKAAQETVEIFNTDHNVNFGSDALAQSAERISEAAKNISSPFETEHTVNLGSQALLTASREKNADKDEVSFDFGGSKLIEVSENLNTLANEGLDSVVESVNDVISTVKTSISEVSGNTHNFLDEQFGETLDAFAESVNTIVAPDLEKIEIAADATAQAVDGTTTAVETIDDELKKGTFLDKLGDKIASLTSGWSKADTSQSETFGTAVITSFCDKMGEAGEVASKLASNMSTMGPVLGAIATALEYVFEGLNQVIGTVLTDIVEYGLEPLRELGRVLGELLIPIFEALAPQLEKVMEFSKILFNALGSVLQPIFNMVAKIVDVLSPVFDVLVEVITTIAEVLQSVGVILETVLQPVLSVISTIIKTALAPALELISVILEILSPVLKVFAKIVVTITGTIQYVVQILQHWVATLMNWLAGLNLLGWHPFSGLRMNDPGAPGSYSAYIQSKWDSIDQAFEGASSLTEGSSVSQANTSTTTAVTSAGYQGATQVTINIYQQAPVVGDMGMRAFAQMIRTEFEAMSYYGVTA